MLCYDVNIVTSAAEVLYWSRHATKLPLQLPSAIKRHGKKCLGYDLAESVKKCDREQLNSKPKRKLVAIRLAMFEVIEGD
jgi:hypothetical protein